jgi:retinol-binding protein 3
MRRTLRTSALTRTTSAVPSWVRAAAVLVALAGATAARAQSGDPARLLSPAEQQGVVQTTARLLDERYVFPDSARKLRDHLEQRLRDGAFSETLSAREFETMVNAEIRQVCRDGHLRFIYDPEEVAALRNPAADSSNAPLPGDVARERRKNFGLREARILDGNVGYLDIRDFAYPPLCAGIAAGAMAFLAGCDALIVDLRGNGGGYAETVAFLLSYFFPPGQSITLNSFFVRGEEAATQLGTLPVVPGKPMPHVPLYVLTSRRTFSGGEEFAYDLKHLKRAVLVGEVTGGGANNPDDVVVNDDFVLSLPVGRPVNAITGTNWEGVGVTPDIAVPCREAFDVAYREALRTLLKSAPTAQDSAHLQWSLDGLEERLHASTPSADILRSCVGTYGDVNVTLDGGRLFFQQPGRPGVELLPLDGGTFWVRERDSYRLRFVRERGRAAALLMLYDDGRVVRRERLRGGGSGR